MPYTNTHTPRESAEQLRTRIPGWGLDSDPADRPSVPMERPETTGAHWEYPDEQVRDPARERSVEHTQLPPVYGTAQPLHGLSGAVRRYAYARFSEGRAAHWLLLILGDRIEAIGAHARSLFTLRPDNPVTETGVVAEFSYGAVRSRLGRGRIDLRHIWLDPIIVAGPWILAAWVVLRLVRRRKA